MNKLPQYLCHKKVRACQIGLVHKKDGQWLLTPADESISQIVVTEHYMKKHQPAAGGYFVLYEDGYESFSPAEAFESGYSRIEE